MAGTQGSNNNTACFNCRNHPYWWNRRQAQIPNSINKVHEKSKHNTTNQYRIRMESGVGTQASSKKRPTPSNINTAGLASASFNLCQFQRCLSSLQSAPCRHSFQSIVQYVWSLGILAIQPVEVAQPFCN